MEQNGDKRRDRGREKETKKVTKKKREKQKKKLIQIDISHFLPFGGKERD